MLACTRLVITTYQTLANYAVTFAQTPFEVAVFDEIQNLKNPSTLRSNAAKAVNAEFRIGLTGTPVENATRDIWAVMDQLFPGALGSLNDFRIAFVVPKRGKTTWRKRKFDDDIPCGPWIASLSLIIQYLDVVAWNRESR